VLIAVAAIAAAPPASYANSTSTLLQATLIVLPSCSFSSLHAQNEKDAGRPPRVTCNGAVAPQVTISRERLPANTSAFLSKATEGGTRPESDERGDVTVITTYLF